MGNPPSGAKVQMTTSLSTGRHRQSLAAASIQLEKLSQQERFGSNDKPSSGTLSPRLTEDKSIAAFLGDKKTKRRARSSLGGSEEFIKGLELNTATISTEERKPAIMLPYRGHRRVGSGNVTPSKSLDSPRAKVVSTSPGKEKYAVAKIAASLFHSPTKLERSMSLSRVAHRPVSEGEGTPRCRSGIAIGEVILPGKRGKSQEFKRHESRPQTPAAQTSQGDADKEFTNCLFQAKNIDGGIVIGEDNELPLTQTGPCNSLIYKAGLQSAIRNDEGLSNETSVAPIGVVDNTWHGRADSLSGSSVLQEQVIMDPVETAPAPLTIPLLKYLAPVRLSPLEKPHTQQVPFRTLDANCKNDEMAPISSYNRERSMPSTPSSRKSHTLEFPAPPEAGENQNTASECQLHVTQESTGHRDGEPSLTTQDLVLSESDSLSLGSLASDKQVQHQETAETNAVTLASTDNLPLFSLESAEPSMRADHQDPKPTQENGTQIEEANGDSHLATLSPEKVTEEELTEAAFLSSLVCENDSVGPVLISEESKQFPLNSSDGGDMEVVRMSMDDEIFLKEVCKPEPCLTRGNSFETGMGEKSKNEHEIKSKLRKRRRSVSASGIGAMLLKVVRVSDSGPIVTRKLPKVGPEISEMDQMRARNYVVQKTAQISTGEPQLSMPTPHQDAADKEVKPLSTEAVDMDLDSGDSGIEVVVPEMDAQTGIPEKFVSSDTDADHLKDAELEAPVLETAVDNSSAQELSKDTEECQKESSADEPLQEETTELSSDPAGIEIPINPGDLEKSSLSVEEEQHEQHELDPHQGDSILTSKGSVDETLYDKEIVDQEVPAPEVSKKSGELAGERAIAEDTHVGGRRRRPGSKGRLSYDLDIPTEGHSKKLDSTEANNGLVQAQTVIHVNKQALSLLDENVAITREKSQNFTSIVIQGSPRQSLDEYRLAPSSISILANPSFSSSHQDRLWEEQAEAYSSGGRGTPGREDDTAANAYLHSPSPGGAISSDDQIHSSSGSIRKCQTEFNTAVVPGLSTEKVRNNEKKKGQGKKRGRPRTPLRSLLAEDTHSKGLGSSSSIRSPEGGHFLQQIMSRIRGNSSKSLSPKSPEAMPKRRNTLWTSCICFSVK